eukprot:TRINITY_DN88661_c0_g1_i1.p1 TRINITY_DN88661_c0_g1~~TRINITY_DN88661_c0_g1_i1.p1  ORF type:complete len:128 (+),score=9.87 TRINITY_DN88661_c0_g1_i1:203-586(+)
MNFHILLLVVSCALAVEIAGINLTREELEDLLVGAGKQLKDLETYKLAICTIATAAKMKFDEAVLAKIYEEKKHEDRSIKVQLLMIKSCIDRMHDLAKVPVISFLYWSANFYRRTQRSQQSQSTTRS